jgi:HPt (histidine-containing phosphotransfer) domain-containing protein
MTDTAVLDVEVLDALRALGPRPGGLLDEMARIFLLELPVEVAEMAAAVVAGDRAAVVFPAHKLRGTSGHLGATRLSQVCAALERTAPHGNRAQMDDLIVRLREEAALALMAVRELVDAP